MADVSYFMAEVSLKHRQLYAGVSNTMIGTHLSHYPCGKLQKASVYGPEKCELVIDVKIQV